MDSTSDQQTRKPLLVTFAIPPAAVSAFARAVVARVIPDGFWGDGQVGESNKQLMMRKVDQFIVLRKFESLSLHEVLQGFKVGLT